ncbi:MAG: hypothetical protein HKN07_03960, partial [Acidimicrobiia bacterium]|nr:hypothetical protein [Acidimicrobiia bacterium]
MRYRVAAEVDGTVTSLLLDIQRGVSVGELCAQLEATIGGDWTRGIFLHGEHFDQAADADQLSLSDGVMLSATDRATPLADLAIELQGIAGELAGVHHRLTRGSYTAAPDGQIPVPTASDVRLTVEREGTVLVDPPGTEAVAVNGILIDGPAVLHIGDSVQIGGTVWRLARPSHDSIQRQRVLFNRPPRLIAHAPEITITPALRKPDPAKRTTLRWTTIVAPLLMGLAMFAMFQRLIFLAFMLLSPVMAGFNWIDDKFRVKKERKRNEEDFIVDLGRFETTVAAWRTATRRYLAARHRDLSSVVNTGLQVRTDLWERRPHHDDFLSLVVGYGRCNLPVPLTRQHNDLDDEVVAALLDAGSFEGVSIAIGAAGSSVVGVCGERPAALGLVRSLLTQAAVHHGPADLQIAVITCPRWATDWSWTAWLPHVEGPTGSRLLATGMTDRDLVRSEVGRSPAQTLVVIDADPDDEVATLISDLQTAEGVSVIALATRAERLPSTADPVIVVESAARVAVTHPTKATAIEGLSPAL